MLQVIDVRRIVVVKRAEDFFTPAGASKQLSSSSPALEQLGLAAAGRGHGVAAVALLAAQEALGPHAFRAAQEEGHLHPVRGRQVVPVRGRADPLVHPRRVPLPPATAAPHALTDRR